MIELPAYVEQLRKDIRLLRIHTAVLERSNKQKEDTNRKLREELKRLKEERRKLERERDKLEKELEKYLKTKNRYQIALFDHGNFKHPEEKEKKQKGGQTGHRDTNQDKQRDYQSFPRERIFASSCSMCSSPLTRVSCIKEKVLLDIQITTSSIKKIVESERQWCGTCKKEIRAVSSTSLPFTEYGMNTFMIVLYLRFRGKQSFSTIAQTLRSVFGLEVSKAGVGNILLQARRYLKDRYEELKQAVRDGEIMYNDETGWSVHGKGAWMWIMANETTTVYVAAESRGKGIMEEMYGSSQSYSMHDGYNAYTNTIPHAKQLYCWAHVLRFVYEETVLSQRGSDEHELREKLVRLYQRVKGHPEYSLEEKGQLLQEGLDSLLAMPETSETMRNIQQRLKTQKDGLIRSLIVTHDGTNNLAERELRPVTLTRAISFGSDTYQGMETTAILASVVQTISRDATSSFFPTMKTYLQQGIKNSRTHPS